MEIHEITESNSAGINGGSRINSNAQTHNGCQQYHDGTQCIGHEYYSEWSLPVADLYNQIIVFQGCKKQPKTQDKSNDITGYTDDSLKTQVSHRKQQHDCCKQMHQNRSQNKVGNHISKSSIFNESRSSVPVVVYTFFNKIIANAVKAKLMTIAVRISACGTGSA